MRILNAFEEFFCLRFNLSIDEIISAQRRGLKTLTGVDFRDLEPGGTLPPTIPRITPRAVQMDP